MSRISENIGSYRRSQISRPKKHRKDIMYRKHQMTRILEVASLIHKEPRRWTRPRLAARFEVDKGTIQRYIDLLRDMGIEIVPRGKQGYEVGVVRTNFS